MSHWKKPTDAVIALIVLLSVVALTGLYLNIISLIVLLKTSSAKLQSNTFILNTLVLDLLMTTVAYPTLIVTACNPDDYRAYIGFEFIFNFFGTANTFTLTAAAFQRYTLVSRNRQQGRLQRMTHYPGHIAAISITSFIIAIVCIIIPYMAPDSGDFAVIINLLKMLVTLILPVIGMSVCYYRIYRLVKQTATRVRLNRVSTVSWRTSDSASDVMSPSVHPVEEMPATTEKTVGVRMLFIVHLTLISWFPDSLVATYMASCNCRIKDEYWILMQILAFSCVIYNPILNVALHSYLKQPFKQLITCQRKLNRISPDSTSYMEMKTNSSINAKALQIRKASCTMKSLDTLISFDPEEVVVESVACCIKPDGSPHVTINDGILLKAPCVLRTRQPSLSPSMISTISSAHISHVSDDTIDTGKSVTPHLMLQDVAFLQTPELCRRRATDCSSTDISVIEMPNDDVIILYTSS